MALRCLKLDQEPPKFIKTVKFNTLHTDIPLPSTCTGVLGCIPIPIWAGKKKEKKKKEDCAPYHKEILCSFSTESLCDLRGVNYLSNQKREDHGVKYQSELL